MSSRTATTFGLLILTQAAHSMEEYARRFWESFLPARFMSGVMSGDLRLGFLVLNVALVTFGVWCYLWPVSRGWRGDRAIALGWAMVDNGVGHPLWAVRQGGYAPGVATAPVLLVLAIALLRQIRRTPALTIRQQSAP